MLCPLARPLVCLVLYHGGGNDRLFGFWSLIERMLACGVAVATADLPGHGLGATDFFSTVAAQERLDALVAVAKAETGVSDVVVLGQSMGGAFALDQLIRNDLSVAVVAVSVPVRLTLDPRVLLELPALLGPAARRVLAYVPLSRAWPAFGPFGRDRFPIRTATAESYVAVFRQTLARLDLPGRLTGIRRRRPVLLVHGDRDGIASFSHGNQLAQAVGDDAWLLKVPKGSHFDVLLRDDVVDHIAAWLLTLASTGMPG